VSSKRKNFNASQLINQSCTPDSFETQPVVYLGSHVVYKGDRINLSKWLGRGIDSWVWASVNQLRALHAAGAMAKSTLMTIGAQSVPCFFNFLIDTGAQYGPESIERRNINQYIEWIKGHSNWSPKTQKQKYILIKSLLLGMSSRGLVPLNTESFPISLATDGWKTSNSEKAFSGIERSLLAEAIRKDVISIHHNDFSGNDCDTLTIYILAIALRTGMNTTPLLELTRTALGPHPFMPNMRILSSFKRRGYSTNLKSIRKTENLDNPTSVPMDGVALYEKALALTSPLVDMAPEQYKNYLWLFRKPTKIGSIPYLVSPMKMADLEKGINRFIKRHKLTSESGTPLRLNISRLRKTMENRLWQISNGDLFSVALIMGHQQKIADTHYLQVTSDLQQNATIVGEALPVMYKYGVETQGKIPIKLEKTPVGNCTDSLYGELAPGNGVNYCGDFMSCFKCRSYALVGSLEDLHRLFSFYWFLKDEAERITSKEWKQQHKLTLFQIDSFTEKNFPKNLIQEAKQLAKIQPHKFWKNYQEAANKGINKNGS
jgi:hypothetical protein